ncbi:sulfite exporter TauE/SafE family protein [Nanoarchaeota archaeon]
MDYLLILVFVLGFVSSVFGTLVGGGGGIIAVPILIFLGLPPTVAIATNKMGAIGSVPGSIYNFIKAHKINYWYSIPFLLISLVGGYIGANMLVEMNEKILTNIIAIIIVGILPLLFVRDLGINKKTVPKFYIVIGMIVFFGLSIYGGLFGVAGGLLGIYAMILLFGTTYIQANAWTRLPALGTFAVAIYVFAVNGLINYEYGIALALGSIFGGYVGSKTALIKGDKFVRVFFTFFVILSALKLIFF